MSTDSPIKPCLRISWDNSCELGTLVNGSDWRGVPLEGITAVEASHSRILVRSCVSRDTWQLFINTGTTIVTFLMVFLIQNTQNRDARAIHLKLNELIHAVDKGKEQNDRCGKAF
jgi:Low affinity iron permease